MNIKKELLSEVEILGALTACSNKKGDRCSQCPVFGRGWNRQCRQIVDKAVVKLIENQKKKVENLEYTLIEVMHSMEDFTNGIQKNFCTLAQRECAYCNNLGKCELTGYCYYKTSPPSYGTTTTPNEIVFVKAPDILPEVLVINGERYIKEHKT